MILNVQYCPTLSVSASWYCARSIAANKAIIILVTPCHTTRSLSICWNFPHGLFLFIVLRHVNMELWSKVNVRWANDDDRKAFSYVSGLIYQIFPWKVVPWGQKFHVLWVKAWLMTNHVKKTHKNKGTKGASHSCISFFQAVVTLKNTICNDKWME